MLNGEGVNSDRPVNNVCFPSAVAPKYAPEGKSLASVTVVGLADGVSDEALASSCKTQLEGWFGESVKEWNFLRSYRIKHSQPGQTPPNGNRFERHPEVMSEGLREAASQHSKHSTKQHNKTHATRRNQTEHTWHASHLSRRMATRATMATTAVMTTPLPSLVANSTANTLDLAGGRGHVLLRRPHGYRHAQRGHGERYPDSERGD